MDKSKLLKYSLINALSAAVYVALIATLIFNAERLLSQGKPDTILAPIAFLMLFVLSAAVMGMLIFGRSVYLYLQGQLKDAVRLAFYTVGNFSLITLIVLITLYFVSHN